MSENKTELQVGDKLHRIIHNDIFGYVIIDRVTSKQAFAGHIKFWKHQDDMECIYSVGSSNFQYHYSIETPFLHEKAKRKMLTHKLSNFFYTSDKLNSMSFESLEKIAAIIGEETKEEL